MFKNKIILITGGTGSFGHSFLAKLLKTRSSLKEIRIFSRDEKKQDDMRNSLNFKIICSFSFLHILLLQVPEQVHCSLFWLFFHLVGFLYKFFYQYT